MPLYANQETTIRSSRFKSSSSSTSARRGTSLSTGGSLLAPAAFLATAISGIPAASTKLSAPPKRHICFFPNSKISTTAKFLYTTVTSTPATLWHHRRGMETRRRSVVRHVGFLGRSELPWPSVVSTSPRVAPMAMFENELSPATASGDVRQYLTWANV